MNEWMILGWKREVDFRGRAERTVAELDWMLAWKIDGEEERLRE